MTAYEELPHVSSDRTAELAGRGVALLVRDPDDARLVLDALGLLDRLREARTARDEAAS